MNAEDGIRVIVDETRFLKVADDGIIVTLDSTR